MRFAALQIINFIGAQVVLGQPTSINKHHSLANLASRGIDGELYEDEVNRGDQIGQGVDATVYKATVNAEGWDGSTTFAYKTSYNDPNAVNREYEAYAAVDGQGIAPGFQARVTNMDTLDYSGLLLDYIETTLTDENNADHGKGALKALETLHSLGCLHGDTFSLGNVLVSKADGSVKLVDFAKAEKSSDERKREEEVNLLKMAFSGVDFDS
ncbi:hypothetical protein F4808DRAFT_453172 [Astrocystis sublimbata]|nr:hypothetical protein F4808DRAFT_466304 [Astrocystis sublimbata]KAI0193896.1 hypothetical protein F4808DRAFT_453172 [Astrocystis sublimbata]